MKEAIGNIPRDDLDWKLLPYPLVPCLSVESIFLNTHSAAELLLTANSLHILKSALIIIWVGCSIQLADQMIQGRNGNGMPQGRRPDY